MKKTSCISPEEMGALVDNVVSRTRQESLLTHILECNECYEEYITLLELNILNKLDIILPRKNEEHSVLIKNEEFDFSVNSYDFNSTYTSLAASSKQNIENSLKEDVQQAYLDTCAIKAQQIILKDFGINISEEKLREEAIANGWFKTSSFLKGGGTEQQNIGKLLEYHNINIQTFEGNGNINALIKELAQGHEVIVEVDSNSLWNPSVLEKIKDTFIGKTPNHVIIVAGINTSDINDIKVIIKDPGTGDAAKEYNIENFMDAWKDSNYFMVSTTNPVPNMQNFDYDKGHIDSVGKYTYQEFDKLVLDDKSEPFISSHHDTNMTDLTGNTYFINKTVDFIEHIFHNDYNIDINIVDVNHDITNHYNPDTFENINQDNMNDSII